jgi:hypothetical protein
MTEPGKTRGVVDNLIEARTRRAAVTAPGYCGINPGAQTRPARPEPTCWTMRWPYMARRSFGTPQDYPARKPISAMEQDCLQLRRPSAHSRAGTRTPARVQQGPPMAGRRLATVASRVVPHPVQSLQIGAEQAGRGKSLSLNGLRALAKAQGPWQAPLFRGAARDCGST